MSMHWINNVSTLKCLFALSIVISQQPMLLEIVLGQTNNTGNIRRIGPMYQFDRTNDRQIMAYKRTFQKACVHKNHQVSAMCLDTYRYRYIILIEQFFCDTITLFLSFKTVSFKCFSNFIVLNQKYFRVFFSFLIKTVDHIAKQFRWLCNFARIIKFVD